MVGLINNNNLYLKEFNKIFFDKKKIRSNNDYIHWNNFKKLCLIKKKNELFKYIYFKKLINYYLINKNNYTISNSEIDKISLKLNAYRLVFINGSFISILSDNYIGPWSINIKKGKKKNLLFSPIKSEIFLHLIESLSHEMTIINLSKNIVSKKPLYILHINKGNENQKKINTIFYRHHFNIKENSESQIIEHFVSIKSSKYFTGTRTSINVNNNTKLKYIKIINENKLGLHFGNDDIKINNNASVDINNFILQSDLTKYQMNIQSNGIKSNLNINTLILSKNKNINYINTYLEHNKGYCSSKQLHKIIAKGNSKTIFNGLIKVEKLAVKTNSEMINKNLLLNNKSEIKVKPQLEIYSDDVKCSHGATFGQIDKDQIFYLCSRCISYKNAKNIIINAFSKSTTEFIDNNIVRNNIFMLINNILQK